MAIIIFIMGNLENIFKDAIFFFPLDVSFCTSVGPRAMYMAENMAQKSESCLLHTPLHVGSRLILTHFTFPSVNWGNTYHDVLL